MLKLFVGSFSDYASPSVYTVTLVIHEHEEKNIEVIWPCKVVSEIYQADVAVKICDFYAKDVDIRIKYDRIPELSSKGVEKKIIKSSDNDKME